jgi:flagellar biosynthesis protein FlhG
VGKTNLAVNLAVCLRSRGMGVTLVDLDVGLANADVLLGVRPRRNLADVLAGRQELADVAEETAGGISFIAGASGRDGLGPLRDTERTALAGALAGWDDDFVIFDCAAGIAPDVMTFAQAADVVLVVTTPEPTALTDAYATVKTLRRAGYGGSVRLLVNMVHSRGEAKATLGRFQRVCEKFMKFPIADAGFILHDERVELAVRHRVPFVVRYPKSSASICAQAVAARLLRGKVTRRRHADVSGHSDVPGRSGLLSRVADMFS